VPFTVSSTSIGPSAGSGVGTAPGFAVAGPGFAVTPPGFAGGCPAGFAPCPKEGAGEPTTATINAITTYLSVRWRFMRDLLPFGLAA
jgi:hypothetical protein